jgi:hypothetical protein
MNTPYQTREEWLTAAVAILSRSVFTPSNHVVPPVKVSCSWPGGGSARKRIGECWSTKASEAGVNEVFISPTLSDPINVLDVLTHELCHAVDDCAHGHRKPFVAIANSVGLVGKPTQARAGADLLVMLNSISAQLGPYPHSRLNLSMRNKQSTRLLKLSCEDCGAVWRMAATWADKVAACPCCGSEHVEHPV